MSSSCIVEQQKKERESMILLNEYIGKRTSNSELEDELCILKEEKTLISFRKQTKDREYVKIKKSSHAYPQVKGQREPHYMTKNIVMAFDKCLLTCLPLMDRRHV